MKIDWGKWKTEEQILLNIESSYGDSEFIGTVNVSKKLVDAYITAYSEYIVTNNRTLMIHKDNLVEEVKSKGISCCGFNHTVRDGIPTVLRGGN